MTHLYDHTGRLVATFYGDESRNEAIGFGLYLKDIGPVVSFSILDRVHLGLEHFTTEKF